MRCCRRSTGWRACVWPLVTPLRRRAGLAARAARRRPSPPVSDEEQQEATTAYLDAGEQEGLIERDERQLLQSIVDFGDTLVHEVMTPRPDIVAIRSDATLAELRAFFREQEYSRIPVYVDSLDNIAGFVFIKDLMRLPESEPPDRPVSLSCARPTSCRRPSACPTCSASSSGSSGRSPSSSTSTAARPAW